MCRWSSLLVALVAASWAGPASFAAEPVLYKPQGQGAFDFWYAKSGDVYHAFYLQTADGSITLGMPR